MYDSQTQSTRERERKETNRDTIDKEAKNNK